MVRAQKHLGIVVIEGGELDEGYVCAALDSLLELGARRKEDHENLYMRISENQLSIDTEDGNTLIIGSDGTLALRDTYGNVCRDRKQIDRYIDGQ
jgi:hypothetical protein